MNIILLKSKLIELGYGKGILHIDGPDASAYGPKTTAIVEQFQKDNGLKPDGIVGPATMILLFPPKTNIHDIQPLPDITGLSLNHAATVIAISQNGVRELTGANDGPAVETYLNYIGLPKGYAWCMAFVYWCYAVAAKALNVTNPLLKTGGCIAQLNYAKTGNGLSVFIASPQVFDIFIIDLGNGAGHTGIIVDVDKQNNLIQTIEGNTNEQSSPAGDGVYKRIREIERVNYFIRLK